MTLSIASIILGLILLMWSADKFVEGAAGVAKSLGMSTLLVGMIVVGFGTSAPELSVSALSAFNGNPGIALGNGYGSNIANIALVLGVTALISPVIIQRVVLKKELPILIGVTLLALVHLWDGQITRLEAIIEIVVLIGVFTWIVLSSGKDPAGEDEIPDLTAGQSWFWLLLGLVLLVVSSRMLVWGAVNIAHTFGVSDLIIGLTVIAIGTSLPELAASVIAARKGEHDLAVGNIIGSNLFNTLAVVGLAGTIHPMQAPAEVLSRDWPLMFALTVLILLIGYMQKSKPMSQISRSGGALLLAVYIGYTVYLISTTLV
jgi:cation:H+ antiporter